MGRNVTRNNRITHRLRHLSLFDVIIGTRAAEIGGDGCKRREQQQADWVSHLGGGAAIDESQIILTRGKWLDLYQISLVVPATFSSTEPLQYWSVCSCHCQWLPKVSPCHFKVYLFMLQPAKLACIVLRGRQPFLQATAVDKSNLYNNKV